MKEVYIQNSETFGQWTDKERRMKGEMRLHRAIQKGKNTNCNLGITREEWVVSKVSNIHLIFTVTSWFIGHTAIIGPFFFRKNTCYTLRNTILESLHANFEQQGICVKLKYCLWWMFAASVLYSLIKVMNQCDTLEWKIFQARQQFMKHSWCWMLVFQFMCNRSWHVFSRHGTSLSSHQFCTWNCWQFQKWISGLVWWDCTFWHICNEH